MPYTAFIIDDEQPARDIIRHYAGEIKDIVISGEFADGFSAVKAINTGKPDIVFLDVQMPRLTGFEVVELLEHKPLVVFSTAYDQYAIQAFEVQAVDYLLKPYSKERFLRALDNVLDKLHGKADVSAAFKIEAQVQEKLKRIAVRTGQNIHVLPVDSLTHIEAEGDYVRLHTPTGSYLKEKPMRYYETQLDNGEFVRIHRSYIVNVSFIDRIEYYDKESYVAILKNSSRLKVSTAGYKALRNVLNL